MRLLHIFPDLMNLYGEYANVRVMERFLLEQGAQVTTETLSLYDTRDISGYDFYFMGAGTERNQKLALSQLTVHRDAIAAAIQAGKVLLFTGNAWELLGRAVTDASGHRFEALDLAAFETTESKKRIVGDAIAYYGEKPVVGFVNKCSVTSGVANPFLHMALGFGNESECGPEGWHEKNLYATHLTGPVLVKNPALLRELAGLLLGGRLPDDCPMWPSMERAFAVAFDELSRRLP